MNNMTFFKSTRAFNLHTPTLVAECVLVAYIARVSNVEQVSDTVEAKKRGLLGSS
jgi:hypothetical protein